MPILRTNPDAGFNVPAYRAMVGGHSLWLNPEPRSMWNTGDSEMRHFAPYCHQVDECSTLKQLERVVSRLLRSS